MPAATMLAQQITLWDLPSRPFLWAWPGGVGWEHHGPSCLSSLSRREWQGGDHRPDKRGIVSTRTPASPHPGTTAGLQIRFCLTSVLTCMTPSSVSVLVSITGIPSAVKSAKIFWWSQMWEVVKINLWRPSERWPAAASALVWWLHSLMKVTTSCLQRRQSPRLNKSPSLTPTTLQTDFMSDSERSSTHLVFLRQLGDFLHVTLVSNNDERLQTGLKLNQESQRLCSHWLVF